MAGEDDLLDPSEIDALLAQANGEQPLASAPKTPAPSSGDAGDGLLNPSDIEALLREHGTYQGGPTASPERSKPSSSSFRSESKATEHLLDQAEANLAAALASNLGGNKASRSRDTSNATPFQLNDLVHSLGAEERAELSLLQDVELDVRIELGRAELLIEEVVSLKAGSVVPLDKLAGDPVDILVNGKLIARGEVLVLNDNFCVRVAEILTPRE